MTSRSVEWPHYHIWTDALRGRDLANEAVDEWDRGMFVRWSLQSAWTTFEEVARQAINLHHFGNRFWEKFDDQLNSLGVTSPSRGSGVWQRMAAVHKERNKYAHLIVADQRDLLLPDARLAVDAIQTIREAVHDLHRLISKIAPSWIDDDTLPRHPRGGSGSLTVGRGIRDSDDPRNIRITYLYLDRESTSYVLPPDADPWPYLEDVVKSILVPISRVRAYQDGDVIAELIVRMRGSAPI